LSKPQTKTKISLDRDIDDTEEGDQPKKKKTESIEKEPTKQKKSSY